MLYRSPRPRYARPPPYSPKPRHDGYQWDTAHCDGNQNSFPIHPSRNGNSHLPLRGLRPTAGSYPRHSIQRPPMRAPMNRPPTRVQRPPFHTQRPPFQDHRLSLDGQRLPPQAIRPQQHQLPPQSNSSYGYYRDAYWTEESEYDPYNIETGQSQDLYDPYNLESDVVPYNTTQTNDLTLVTNKSEPVVNAPSYGTWTNSSSEPVVRNKELDDWVPSSAETRVTPAAGDKEVSYEEYEKWRHDKGVGFKGGVGIKRKMHKAPKGVYTAAGKHPIGALKEKIPTCEFTEECRERNDELKYWKLTASVKFSGYKFLGYGVTMKIAKAEAAIKALTYLDVLGIPNMMDHIVSEDYLVKQKLMESVLREEQEEQGVEEPWYIKVDDQAESSVPVFRPKELPTPETHPTMFLNQWFGPEVRCEYEIENPGFKPQIFSCTMTVQDRSFQGSGPSKKEAQRITAALTLRRLEKDPPPIDNRKLSKRKGKKPKKPKTMSGVADFPTLPSKIPRSGLRTEDKVPVEDSSSLGVVTGFIPAESNSVTSLDVTSSDVTASKNVASSENVAPPSVASTTITTTEKAVGGSTSNTSAPIQFLKKPIEISNNNKTSKPNFSGNKQTWKIGGKRTDQHTGNYNSNNFSANRNNYISSNNYSHPNNNWSINSDNNSYNNSYNNNYNNDSGYSAPGYQGQYPQVPAPSYQYPQAGYTHTSYNGYNPPLPNFTPPPPPPPPS